MKTCDKCQWFAPAQHQCRRHPPIAILIPIKDATGALQPKITGLWPPVSEGDWCGEHDPAVLVR